MNAKLLSILVLPALFLCHSAAAQKLIRDVPYMKGGHKRHVLDIYMPEKAGKKGLPVMFWIHGGGWVVGAKSDVVLKPKVLTERGFVFVSTNYRLLPKVKMETLIVECGCVGERGLGFGLFAAAAAVGVGEAGRARQAGE